MSRYLLFLALLVLAATTSTAQLDFPGFRPSQCQPAAEGVIAGASDAKVVAIVTLSVNEGGFSFSFDEDDGTAAFWMYFVYSEALDTLTTAPFVRVLGACNDDLFPDPGEQERPDGALLAPVPEGYLEGTGLVGKLKGNASYQAFKAANPDSVPTFVALISIEQGGFGFPDGSPVWTFVWIPADQSAGFNCIVHAINGTTLCFGDEPNSVASEASERGFGIAPNPASTDAVVRLPESWVGSKISIEAVDASGRVVHMVDNAMTIAPFIMINTQALATGMWSLRVSNGRDAQTLPLSIVR